MYFGAVDSLRAAASPQKVLVFLTPIPSPAPDTLRLELEHLDTRSRSAVSAQRHASEYGTEWGANIVLDRRGCWALEIREPAHNARIVVQVDQAR